VIPDKETTKSNIELSQNGTTSILDDNLPMIEAKVESYLLNGIVKCVELQEDEHARLLSTYPTSHIFEAVRLPTRKRTFQIRSQVGFNKNVPSQILITPYTVAIVIKINDL